MTVAHEIFLGRKKKKNGNYRIPLITIWHNDPEIKGNDDSCGYSFAHVPEAIYKKVLSDFEFEFKHGYWFDKEGNRKFSTMGVTLCMYSRAAWTYFIWKHHDNTSGRSYRQYQRFMRKYLFDFLHFAENSNDSLYNSINKVYGEDPSPERFAHTVIRDIITKDRPWYKHPKWHIHHWKIQFVFFRDLKRRYWDKCSICGKRGFGNQSACSNWQGDKIWHCECSGTEVKQGTLAP